MKKTLRNFLVLAVVLAVLSPSVLAVDSNNNVSEDDYTITMGASIISRSESGKVTVEEITPSTQHLSAREMAVGIQPTAVYQKTIEHIKYFLNDSVKCRLTATFSYEPGYSVYCTNRTGSTTITNSSLEKVRDYTSVTQGAANRFTRVTYTSVILKPNNDTVECIVWIECSRGGTIIKN